MLVVTTEAELDGRCLLALSGGNAGHKKTDQKVGFFRILVPRGRLELPLLSKTDFESAASTNSAIRACGAQYREVLVVGQSAFMVNFHTLG